VDITKADLYSRFSFTGKEISAFVVHRDFEWPEIASLSSDEWSEIDFLLTPKPICP
jgi:hypothetical protein